MANNNIGDEIRNAIQQSLKNGDPSHIEDAASRAAEQALKQARDAVVRFSSENGIGRTPTRYSSGRQGQPGSGTSARGYAAQPRQSRAYVNGRPVRVVSGREMHAVGNHGMNGVPSNGQLNVLFKPRTAAGILSIIFGVLGLIFFGTFSLAALLMESPLAIIMTILFDIACIRLIRHGADITRMDSDAKLYIRLCRGRTYINIDELAACTGESKARVLRKVRRMLRKGVFPQGHLDKSGNCLMLTESTYREYLALERERMARENETAPSLQEELAKGGSGKKHQTLRERRAEYRAEKARLEREEAERKAMYLKNPTLAEIIEQGEAGIKRLHEINEQIPGEEITNKLFRVENSLRQIFDRVKEHPENLTKIRKTTDYYLPTTIKLMEAYAEYDSIPNPNDEVIKAKDELEKTLDTINAAFTEMLNQLYSQSIMDVTAEATVLQSMLQREGLTGTEFDGKTPIGATMAQTGVDFGGQAPVATPQAATEVPQTAAISPQQAEAAQPQAAPSEPKEPEIQKPPVAPWEVPAQGSFGSYGGYGEGGAAVAPAPDEES